MKPRRSALRSRKELLILFLLVFSFTNVLAGDRFVIGTGDANNTVYDTTTGLMWDRSPAMNVLGWDNAKSFCENLNGSDGRGGYEDWRLSDIYELFSLMDYSYYAPALSSTSGLGKYNYSDPFYLGGYNANAWVSTVRLDSTGSAWAVYIKYGNLVSFIKSDYTKAFAWCVRGSMNNLSGSSIEEKIVYVNNTIYVNNTNCPICESVNSSIVEKIVYVNNTINNTVYVNNCTSKNLTCENKSSEKSLDYKTGIVAFSVMGLVIIGLIGFIFWKYSVHE